MAGETTITVVGNLVADPELRFTPSGAGVVNFTVASTRRTFDRDTNQWKDGDALYMRCSAWRQMAENIAESVSKGARVVVTGALKQRTYEAKDGGKHTVIELDVDEFAVSLRFATASVTKAARTNAAPAESGWGQAAQGAGDDNPWAVPAMAGAAAATRPF